MSDLISESVVSISNPVAPTSAGMEAPLSMISGLPSGVIWLEPSMVTGSVMAGRGVSSVIC